MRPGHPPRPRRQGTRRLFVPILAGATGRDRAIAAVGAGAALAAVGLLGLALHGGDPESPWIVAPVGASAVLLFAIPASPLAQPWPVIGGSALSALVGVCVERTLGGGAFAAGLALTLAIGAMSLARCLHPPGGAAALLAIVGGPAAESAGWLLPLAPVALNAAVLVAVGWGFHRFSGHSYPHRPRPAVPAADPLPWQRVGLLPEDVDAVLAEMGETFDIGRDDLALLLRELEARALARERAEPIGAASPPGSHSVQ